MIEIGIHTCYVSFLATILIILGSILQWLESHTDFISSPFYVGGDSYSGIPVPMITQLISNGKVGAIRYKLIMLTCTHVTSNFVTCVYECAGNEAGTQPYINLKVFIATFSVSHHILSCQTRNIIFNTFYEQSSAVIIIWKTW